MPNKQKQELHVIVQENIKKCTLSDYCYICNAVLPNPHNANSHYNSSRHKYNVLDFKASELQKLKSKFKPEKKCRFYCYACNLNISSESHYTEHLAGHKDANAVLKQQNENSKWMSELDLYKPVQNKTALKTNPGSTSTTQDNLGSPENFGSVSSQKSFLSNDSISFTSRSNIEADNEYKKGEYETIMNLVLQKAVEDSPDKETERIKLELLLELEKLVRCIYAPSCVPLECVLNDLKLLNRSITSNPTSADHDQDYGPSIPEKNKPSLFMFNSFNVAAIAGLTILFLRWVLKN